jgi:hypothetical protein
MGFVHANAVITPSKQELFEAWLPSRSWAPGGGGGAGAGAVKKVGEYRFDDPAGEVGIETILWSTADGTLLQVPFTYRATQLEGADEFLVGTAEHTALGPRWVYDGCGDPVWAAALTTAILTGGTQAQMVIERDGRMVGVPPRVPVRGSGSADAQVPPISSVESVTNDGPITTVVAGLVTIALARVVGTPLPGGATLTGAAGGQDLGVLVALRL